MRKITPVLILSLIWICWIIPWQAKKISPEYFGGDAFQFSFAAVVAVLVPVAILMGLRILFFANRRKGLAIIVFAGVVWVFNMGVLGYGGFLVNQTVQICDLGTAADSKTIRKLTINAREVDAVEKRERSARYLYQIFGVTGVWKDENGALVIYAPNEVDQGKYRFSSETDAELKSTADRFRKLGKQMSGLFLLHFGSFVVIMTTGLIYFASRKDKTYLADK